MALIHPEPETLKRRSSKLEEHKISSGRLAEARQIVRYRDLADHLGSPGDPFPITPITPSGEPSTTAAPPQPGPVVEDCCRLVATLPGYKCCCAAGHAV